MNIKFTKHAENKFRILNAHGFTIDKKFIKDAIKKPDNVRKGRT
ncbi:MAG: hypothetical protein KatS3mg003_0285 [Candidatus Nitrosocaldaceae archaeon]|nr:MAG: hypothetical protein KatS3mg003_0285 [Candidatus Nitrosocaldaceae archaeon]